VLIIEDVQELAELVALYLGKEGMETFHCETAELALEKIATWTPDLVILDINLPEMDGYEFLDIFRKKSMVPVLIVSARNADEDIIAGLGYGADEFVTKPFSPRVLVARVRALLRRSQESGSDTGRTINFGPYSLNMETCILQKGTARVSLSAKEFDVLAYLVNNPGKPLSPETIYDSVWKNAYGDITAVAVYVQRLRKKIEENPSNPAYIETVFGMGYRFTANPEQGSERP
jgi:two-component system response regulator RegX3